MRELRLSDRLMRDAANLLDYDDGLDAERWAAEWYGRAWRAAGIGERAPEHLLCLEVIGRACTHPSPAGLAALVALRRVALPDDHSLLDGSIELLAESQPLPPWPARPEATAVRAWRAVDVWGAERVLLVEFERDGAPYTLLAQILTVSGTLVEDLELLGPGAAEIWEQGREPDEPPMPLTEAPVADVLAELASSMRSTDMMWPRPESDYADLRALAWTACRDHLPEWPGFEPIPGADRQALIEAFAPAGDAEAALADLFLDYGDGYLHDRPLGWSPFAAVLFLTDWLPRKAVLDAAQRAALPETLRRWVRFALGRRGLQAEWIDPVIAAIDGSIADFEEAFDDDSAWGPAKQIAAELADRGVDLTDRAAVDQAVRGLNAERLARGLLDEGQ